jgi:hypothetical protein
MDERAVHDLEGSAIADDSRRCGRLMDQCGDAMLEGCKEYWRHW